MLVKFGLSQDSIGQFETFIFVAGLVSFFWIGGLLNTSLSIYHEKADKGKFIFNLLISLVAVNLIVCLSVYLYFTFTAGAFPYLRLLVAYILLNNTSFLIEYIYLMKDDARRLITYGFVIHFLLIFFIFLAFQFFGTDLEAILWALLFYAIVKSVWLIIQLFPFMNIELDLEEMIYIWKYALPLILSLLLAGSGEYIDGIIVKHYFSDSVFAIFRYGAKEIPLVLLIANAFSTSTISKVTQNENDALKYIKKHSGRLIHLLFPLTIVLILFSDLLYEFVFSADFVESASIFRIYALLVIFRLVFPQTILTGMKKNNILLMVSFVEILVNVFLSLIFVRIWGLAGIAFATIIAFFIDKLLASSYCYYKLKIHPASYIPFKLLLPYTLILLLAFYWTWRFA